MLHLPNEILVSILRNLYHIDDNGDAHGTKKNLLATRKVCRGLADLGTPLAFQHVNVLQDQEGYRRLRDLSKSNLRTCVRLLTYSFEDFSAEIVPEDEFEAYMTREDGYIAEKREDIYTDYCRGSQYQSQLHEYNLDVAHLSAAFSLLENLQSIRISQIITDRSGPWFDKYLMELDCLEFLELSTSFRVLDIIAASLSAADTKLETLKLMSSPHKSLDHWPLTGLIQGLNLSKSALYCEAFSHLKTLSVFVPTEGVDNEVNFEGLSGFICSLPALTELVFTGAEHAFTDLLLPDLDSSSRLQSVEMWNLSFDSPTDLTDFFSRHSESLRRVKMHHILLHGGSWEDVFSRMRETLNLVSSEMVRGFYTGSPTNLEIDYRRTYHNGRLVLPYRSIEDFIERRTDIGPFDLLRTYQRKYPEHTLSDDVTQCRTGVCPHFYTAQEAETSFMKDRRKVTIYGIIYALYPSDFHTLGLIFCRQGRMELGSRIMKLEWLGVEEWNGDPQRICRYRDGFILRTRRFIRPLSLYPNLRLTKAISMPLEQTPSGK